MGSPGHNKPGSALVALQTLCSLRFWLGAAGLSSALFAPLWFSAPHLGAVCSVDWLTRWLRLCLIFLEGIVCSATASSARFWASLHSTLLVIFDCLRFCVGQLIPQSSTSILTDPAESFEPRYQTLKP